MKAFEENQPEKEISRFEALNKKIQQSRTSIDESGFLNKTKSKIRSRQCMPARVSLKEMSGIIPLTHEGPQTRTTNQLERSLDSTARPDRNNRPKRFSVIELDDDSLDSEPSPEKPVKMCDS